ncbi:hypothetical protein ABH994_005053 [Bradyrhizobium yuanmingense]
MSVLIKNALGSAQCVQLCFSSSGILSFPLQLKDRSLLLCKASFSFNYIALDLPQRIIDEGLVHQCAQLAPPISSFSVNLSSVPTFPPPPLFGQSQSHAPGRLKLLEPAEHCAGAGLGFLVWRFFRAASSIEGYRLVPRCHCGRAAARARCHACQHSAIVLDPVRPSGACLRLASHSLRSSHAREDRALTVKQPTSQRLHRSNRGAIKY